MSKIDLSHDILNMLERLRIMHDLIKKEDYSIIPKDEIKQDLELTLQKLKDQFKDFVQ